MEKIDHTINEYVLRITGGVYLGEELDPSRVVNITNGNLTIYEVSKRDNNDGTFDVVYKGKFSEGVDFEQSGKAIRGRDKTSESKKTRYAIKVFASEIGETETEEFYKVFQEKLRLNIDRVWDLLKTL